MNNGAPSTVIGVGASAGGVEALSALLGALPDDLDAAVLVVLHLAPTSASVLPSILGRRTKLAVASARDGAPLRTGCVLVAPPDRHLVVDGDHVVLTGGPRENNVRPAVDVLFRSLATLEGRAVVVVLSGAGDDGTAGASEVRDAGGSVYAQDPREAQFPSMPGSVARWVTGATVGTIDEIAAAVVERTRPHETPDAAVSSIDEDDPAADDDPRSEAAQPGDGTGLSCPECGGSLWVQDGPDRPVVYRCRVGHSFGEQRMLDAQSLALESARWAAIVALEERADLLERIADRWQRRGSDRSAARYVRRADEARQQAQVIRDATVRLDMTFADDRAIADDVLSEGR